jgi:hypothetical protein
LTFILGKNKKFPSIDYSKSLYQFTINFDDDELDIVSGSFLLDLVLFFRYRNKFRALQFPFSIEFFTPIRLLKPNAFINLIIVL